MKKTMLALALVALCGCASRQAENQKFVLHDTVYDDYFRHGQWAKTDPDLMTYSEAKRVLADFRIHERGEYADTGSRDYPIRIEPARDLTDAEVQEITLSANRLRHQLYGDKLFPENLPCRLAGHTNCQKAL